LNKRGLTSPLQLPQGDRALLFYTKYCFVKYESQSPSSTLLRRSGFFSHFRALPRSVRGSSYPSPNPLPGEGFFYKRAKARRLSRFELFLCDHERHYKPSGLLWAVPELPFERKRLIPKLQNLHLTTLIGFGQARNGTSTQEGLM
jgi:hypothetical protein